MGAFPDWVSPIAAAAVRGASACLGAWWAYAMARQGALDPLPLVLLAGFLSAQLMQAVFLTAQLCAALPGRLAWLWNTARWAVKRIHLGLSAQFLVMLCGCAIVWFSVFLTLARIEQGALQTGHIAAIAGFTATLGWVFSSYVTARNTQRQNTITLLLNMRHSDVYSRHFNNAYFVAQRPDLIGDRAGLLSLDAQAKWATPGATPCDPCDAPQSALTIRSSYQSVVYVLNYYEFIAAGVRAGALDANIVTNTVSPHMRLYFTTFRTWVDAERTEAGNKRYLRNLQWFQDKFQRRPVYQKPSRPPRRSGGWAFTSALAPKAQPAG